MKRPGFSILSGSNWHFRRRITDIAEGSVPHTSRYGFADSGQRSTMASPPRERAMSCTLRSWPASCTGSTAVKSSHQSRRPPPKPASAMMAGGDRASSQRPSARAWPRAIRSGRAAGGALTRTQIVGGWSGAAGRSLRAAMRPGASSRATWRAAAVSSHSTEVSARRRCKEAGRPPMMATATGP